MVRDQSPSSESGEERHDRFRSERNRPKTGGLKLGCRLVNSEESSRRRRRSRSNSTDRHSRSEYEKPKERRHRRKRDKYHEDENERRSESPPLRREHKRREASPRVTKYEYAYSDSYHYREDRRSKSHTREVKYVIKEDLGNDSSHRSRKHKRDKHKSHKKRHKERHDKGKSVSSEEESHKKRSRSNSFQEDPRPPREEVEKTRCQERPSEVNNRAEDAGKVVSPTQELDDVSEGEDDPLLIGPALPPSSNDKESEVSEDGDASLEVFNGPVVPPSPEKEVIRVTSPERMEVASPERVEATSPEGAGVVSPESEEESAEEGEIVSEGEKRGLKKGLIGPRLPERSQRPVEVGDEVNLYGPALPPALKEKEAPTAPAEEGPAKEETDLSIGPLPQGMINPGQRALEARAAFLKRQLESKEDGQSDKGRREEWMVELPQGRAQALGLGPRKFRAKEGPDLSDRSMWTDTPADKLKKQALAEAGVVSDVVSGKEELERAWIEERDKAMEVLAQEGSKGKKRDLSLLELHQKELKKKKKKEKKEKEDGKVERRPFNRETDLQVNRFDEAQKKSILKKAQLLNTRFSSGESKFL